MKEEMKNVETMETVEAVETETKEGIVSKVKGGIKKYGKPIAGAAVVAVGLIGAFALGKRSGCDSGDYDDISNDDAVSNDAE